MGAALNFEQPKWNRGEWDSGREGEKHLTTVETEYICEKGGWWWGPSRNHIEECSQKVCLEQMLCLILSFHLPPCFSLWFSLLPTGKPRSYLNALYDKIHPSQSPPFWIVSTKKQHIFFDYPTDGVLPYKTIDFLNSTYKWWIYREKKPRGKLVGGLKNNGRCVG